MRVTPAIFLFNRGIVSQLALARVTSEDKASQRVSLSAETQTNWIPRVLGSMMLRPGLEYTGATYNNNKAFFIPFEKATSDIADIEFTDGIMRVWVDDDPISRASVSSAVTNGNFTSDVADWADADEAGCTSAWATGSYLSLIGTSFNAAIRRQEVTVAGGDQNVQHALRLVIERGEVTIKVGSAAGGAQYFELDLTEGEHSLAFTPTGNFHIELSSKTKYASLVDSVNVESSGNVTFTSPYAEADLSLIRREQSGDVIFLAANGYQQYKILRHGTTSWSLVKYWVDDGPFRTRNFTKTTLTPSAVSGDITLTASSNVFISSNVGSVYRIGSIGQYVEISVTAENQWSDPISVSGTDTTRDIAVDVDFSTGSLVGTVTLQRSSDEGTTWAEVKTYSGDTTETYNDELDNQELQYRIGVATGDFTSGTGDLNLTYTTGSLTGVVRITEYSSETSVSAIVLNELGGTDASSDWSEGEWSDRRGFPTSLGIYESRMCFFGRGKYQMSIVDAYSSFDPDFEGDAGAINRTIGFGPVDYINWIYGGSRLLLGADGFEPVSRQSYDDVLTPDSNGFVRSTTIGSARLDVAILDDMPVFVQRCGTKTFGMIYDSTSYKYKSKDMFELAPELGQPSIIKVVAQHQPDKRLHAIRSDGKVVIQVFDSAEGVAGLVLFETDGTVEDVYVQPGDEEDSVYYIVNRTIDGNTVRYREKWALESECVGDTLNKQADSFVSYTGTATSLITGADHLEGEEVVVWADGADAGTYTVTGGNIHLDEAVENYVYGLSYTAQYKSVKLAYGAQGGTALCQPKRIDHIAPVLYKTHYKGLKYGNSFDSGDLYDLPDVYDGVAVADDTIYDTYDQQAFEFDDDYGTDSRLCLQAQAPRPCTVLAVVYTLDTNEKR